MLEFVVTPADARERFRWLCAQSGATRTLARRRLRAAALIGLDVGLAVLAFLVVAVRRTTIASLVPATIAGLLFFAVTWHRSGIAQKRALDRTVAAAARRMVAAAAGVQQVWLDGWGISVRDGDSYLHLDWGALAEVVDTPHYAIIECRADHRIFLPRAAGPDQVAYMSAEIRRQIAMTTAPAAP